VIRGGIGGGSRGDDNLTCDILQRTSYGPVVASDGIPSTSTRQGGCYRDDGGEEEEEEEEEGNDHSDNNDDDANAMGSEEGRSRNKQDPMSLTSATTAAAGGGGRAPSSSAASTGTVLVPLSISVDEAIGTSSDLLVCT
jgi:hypothetical protein